MKALVMETEGKYVIAMKSNGEFVKFKRTGIALSRIEIGQEISIPSSPPISINVYAKIASIAAILLLSVGIGFGSYLYAKPYSYIDVDINPSVELTTNIFNRIIKVKPLNSDGKVIVSTGAYKNASVEDGIANLMDSALSHGYLKADEPSTAGVGNTVLLSVSCSNDEKTDKIIERIRNAAEDKLKSIKVKANLLTEKATIKKHKEAEGVGLSTGKLLLIEQIEDNNREKNINRYKNSSVKDLLKVIRDKDEEVQKDKEIAQGSKELSGNKNQNKNKNQLNKAGNGQENSGKGSPSVANKGDLNIEQADDQGNDVIKGNDNSKNSGKTESNGNANKTGSTDKGKKEANGNDGKQNKGNKNNGQKSASAQSNNDDNINQDQNSNTGENIEEATGKQNNGNAADNSSESSGKGNNKKPDDNGNKGNNQAGKGNSQRGKSSDD